MTDQTNAPVDQPQDLTLNIGDAPVIPEVPKPEPAALDEGVVVVYEKTGDVGLDLALEFIGKQGFGGEHPAVKAASEGDFTMLEALLAQRGVQGYGPMIELGKQAYTRQKEQAANKQAEVRKTVVEAAGGEENWKAVQQWAAANADPEEKVAINAQLNAGGLAAKMAAQYLAAAYAKATNVDITPTNPAAGAGRSTPAAAGPLDPKGYAQAVATLSRTMGSRFEQSKEYAVLQQRRAAFRG